MKASELIKHLQNCIAKYGDLETEVVATRYHSNSKCAIETISEVNSIRVHVTPEYERYQIYWDNDYDENSIRKE